MMLGHMLKYKTFLCGSMYILFLLLYHPSARDSTWCQILESNASLVKQFLNRWSKRTSEIS